MRTKKVNFYPGLKKNAYPFTADDIVCGVDEAGRGPLAGPVFAAAVILPENTRIRGLRDSKQLLREDRERLAKIVEQKAIAIAIEEIDAATIDRANDDGPDLIDTIIAERYKIRQEIGEGGMGTVYFAE